MRIFHLFCPLLFLIVAMFLAFVVVIKPRAHVDIGIPNTAVGVGHRGMEHWPGTWVKSNRYIDMSASNINHANGGRARDWVRCM